MGERQNNRDAVERLTTRYVEHYRQLGRPVSRSDARAAVVEVARVADAKGDRPRPAKQKQSRGGVVRMVQRIEKSKNRVYSFGTRGKK